MMGWRWGRMDSPKAGDWGKFRRARLSLRRLFLDKKDFTRREYRH